MAWALLAIMCLACGDDGDSGPSEPEPPEGEPCAAAGITQNGCTCTEEQPPGTRTCLASKVWSQCTCPPVRDCNPGETIRCGVVCEGENMRREVMCKPDGTYVCPCNGGSAGSGGGGDGG